MNFSLQGLPILPNQNEAPPKISGAKLMATVAMMSQLHKSKARANLARLSREYFALCDAIDEKLHQQGYLGRSSD
jgi:hypothetical protein